MPEINTSTDYDTNNTTPTNSEFDKLTRSRLTSHTSKMEHEHEAEEKTKKSNSSGSSHKKRNLKSKTFDFTKKKTGTSTNDNNYAEDNDSAYESADIFGEMESDHLPWHRPSISSATSNPFQSGTNASYTSNGSSNANELSRSVYETFSKREEVLQKSYADTRFYMTENYLDSETTRYELLLEEMRANSVLKTMDHEQFKLTTTDWDGNQLDQNIEAARDHRIETTKVAWLLKSLKASEDFHLKSNLVRSMFRQTNQFFNTLNDMEITFLSKKHMRELAKHQMIQKLRLQNENEDVDFRSRSELIELANIKEIQSIELRNLKEFYVRMLKKESDGLNDHLDMLENLYNMLHRIYIDIMQMKIRGIKEWYQFRVRNDKSTKESIRQIHDQCDTKLKEQKEEEQRAEMMAVKKEADYQREKRQQIYGDDSSVAVSSELVFSMNMSRRNKLAILDDNSSIGTFVLGDDDEMDVELASIPRNETFLKLVKKRSSSKKRLEAKYNQLIAQIVASRTTAERDFLEIIRKRERESLKSTMRSYFKQEVMLEDKIQESLRYEKNAIDAMQTRHRTELESVLTTQNIQIKKLQERNTKERLGVKQLKEATSELKIRQNDIMLTAHCFHEIRNVLASILCLGENLKEDPESIDSIIGEQNDICNYAIETMSDMLSIAKLKEIGFKPQRAAILVSELFDATIRIQGRRAGAGVRVVKIVDDESLQIFSDKRLLLQLFVNLLSNAAKFTSMGTITLWAARRTEVGQTTSNIVLGVVDTGKGFDLPKISTKKGGEADLSSVTGFVETNSEISNNISEYHTSGYQARNTGYGLYLASTVASALESTLKVQSPVPVGSSMPKLEPYPGSFFYLLQPELSENNGLLPNVQKQKSASGILRGQLITDRQKKSSRSVNAGDTPKICNVETTENLSQTARDNVRNSMEADALERSHWAFAPKGNMRFLVVDDQKLLRQAMIIIIKKLVEKYVGLNVYIETACCAEEALRKHLLHNFDVISLDQYYDNIILSQSVCLSIGDEYPSLCFKSEENANNKKEYVDFKNKEAFRIIPSDGTLVGTDVIQCLRNTDARPVVFSCTASENIAEKIVMMKPYSLEKMEQTLTVHMDSYLSSQAVYLEGATIKKKSNLVLYKMNVV